MALLFDAKSRTIRVESSAIVVITSTIRVESSTIVVVTSTIRVESSTIGGYYLYFLCRKFHF